MMLRAVELGLVDDISEVLEAFIGEGGSQSLFLINKILVHDLDGTILGKHADGRVGDGILCLARQTGSVSQVVDATCRRHV